MSTLGPKPSIEEDVDSAPVQYFLFKDFTRALKQALLSGGIPQKRAERAKQMLGGIYDKDPFVGFPVTNHGETRIDNAVKYDLGDGWRVVTYQSKKRCIFLFVGDHDDTERWLDGHKGMKPGLKEFRPVMVPGSGYTISGPSSTGHEHDFELILDRLDSDLVDYIMDGIPRSLAKALEALTVSAATSDIKLVTDKCADRAKGELLFSVLNLLLAGNCDGARNQIALYKGDIAPLDELSEDDVLEIGDGEDIRRVRIGSQDYEKWLESFTKLSSWHDWFLYLHPEQEKVVEADYSGSAQLSGVSGSGKTCVAVRRALRLAENPEAKVLLLTLNRSLAGMLTQLVDSACTDEELRSRVTVSSFFELAQGLLRSLEPENEKLYADVTWKHEEHVDMVFREFYRQWLNNSDAEVLAMLHRSLVARNVSGESYLREEFDWIRSACLTEFRSSYLTMERRGRRFPILADRRADILQGLDGWERKMRAVGVTDYLGLTSALSRHVGHIKPLFTNILVDEAQDFGTTELSIVRKLVGVGPNDLFLCGDIAQSILPKHRSLADAGISNFSREKIQKNYRNSRQILKAAHAVLSNNLQEEMFDSTDLEILDPKFANFSGPTPMALSADSLVDEISYALAYADSAFKRGVKTVCIAFAGFSARDIADFAKRCSVAALDGGYDPRTDALVFGDLEQTKGYEFDALIIVNCVSGALPPYDAPPEEAYRASCKLYVAMTRARQELILSYHGKASPWIIDVESSIAVDFWREFEDPSGRPLFGVPETLPELAEGSIDLGKITGIQFLYTTHALGLSIQAQDKLVELVDGKGLRSAGGKRLRWQNMQSFAIDFHERNMSRAQIGPGVNAELHRLRQTIQELKFKAN